VVDFKRQINITEDPKINVWLTKVDNEMRLSLATFLEEVMNDITKVEEEKQNMNEGLLRIIEKNPAQVVLLGLQTLWSKKVEDALI
jgi:dynein heavy chain 1